MLQLPVELQRQCLNYLRADVDTLQAARLVNQELGIVATEVLFSTVVLCRSDESAERFTNFAQSSLNDLARCVVIDASDIDPDPWPDELDVLESFANAIIMIQEMENVDEVQIVFTEDCQSLLGYGEKTVGETIKYRIEVLENVFWMLRHVDKLKSLTIKNLQDHMDKELFEGEDFATVRAKLRQLHLNITTDDSWERGILTPQDKSTVPALQQCFRTDLSNFWLKPLVKQLTHLSIHSVTWRWGVIPFVDFRSIGPFPQLRSLSLGKYTIAYDWQVDWILAHSPTLRELCFDECSILPVIRIHTQELVGTMPDLIPVSVGGGTLHFKSCELKWHKIFNRIRTEMTHLHHFTFSFSEHYAISHDFFEDRYRLVTTKLSPYRYYFFDGEDWQVHELLHEAVLELSEMALPQEGLDFMGIGSPNLESEDQDKKALIALLRKVKGKGRFRLLRQN